MSTHTFRMRSTIFAVLGACFALPCIFFIWYTVRLIYLNLTLPAAEIAEHRTGGMLIGAIAFPTAAIIFGFISRYFIKKALRGSREQ